MEASKTGPHLTATERHALSNEMFVARTEETSKAFRSMSAADWEQFRAATPRNNAVILAEIRADLALVESPDRSEGLGK